MQVNPHTSPAPVAGVETAAKTAKSAATESDSAAFSHVDELEKSMRELEDARPEVVKHAAAWVNQRQWPPAETIQRTADLLASKMVKNGD